MKVLIVEDEPLVAQRLERLTREVLGSALKSLHMATTLDAAASHLGGCGETVLLLDLKLGGQDGFELLHRAMVEPWATIVVSGSAERALEAFRLGVVDFVPKPFTFERLTLAFARVRERGSQRQTRFLAVAYAGRVELVPLSSVVAIHGDDDYASVELLDGQRRLHKRRLVELEALLPEEFVRVHRSHMVNLTHVRGLSSGIGGPLVLLPNGRTVPIGRAHRKALRERLT
jgi:DNA-binding LytR/AlgR family response regulator